MSEINDLIERSSQIKNETTKGANTALRVGGLFYDIITSIAAISSDAHYDDSAIRQALAELDEVLDNTITTVNNEQSRLDSALNGISTTVNDKVNQVLNDNTWMEEHASWIHSTTPEGVTTWQAGWNENVEAYLQSAGVWSRDNNIDYTAWSKLTQSVDSINSTISSVQTDLNTKVSTTTFSALQQQVNTLSLTVETLAQADDSSISEALQTAINTSVNDAVNGENGAIAQLNLETTYAKKDAEDVIAWMYSALKNQTTPTKTFNEIVSAGQSDLSSAVSEIRTCIETVNNQLISEANFETKVDNTISGLYSKATAGESSTSIFSQLKQNKEDISSIITSITEDSSSASISTKFANWKSGLVFNSKEGLSKAGIVTTSDLADKVNGPLAGYVQQANYNTAMTSLETRVGNALTIESFITELNKTGSSLVSALNNHYSGYVTKADLESSTSALWSSTSFKDNIGNVASDAIDLSSKADAETVNGINTRLTTAEGSITNINNSIETLTTNTSNASSKADAASTLANSLQSLITGLRTDVDTNTSNIAGCLTKTGLKDAVSALIAATEDNIFSGFITESNLKESISAMMAKNNDFIASIITKVNESGSEIKLSADKIDLVGTTFINKLIADNAFISYLSSGNANIAGNITATSGFIGGWTVDEDRLYSNNARASIRMDLSTSNMNRVCRLGGTEINAKDAMLFLRNDAGTCAAFSSYGDNSKALRLTAQGGNNTFALDSYGNVKFGLRPTENFTFFDPNGDGRKSNNTGSVDFRVPITFNGMSTCHYYEDVYLPSHPVNGMFVFCKECKIFPTNGHPIMEPAGTSVITPVGAWYGTNDRSTFFVYSEKAGQWIAFYCG